MNFYDINQTVAGGLESIAGLPRSWKSHGISGILKFSGISGKVMEFRLKLMKVMEKS